MSLIEEALRRRQQEGKGLPVEPPSMPAPGATEPAAPAPAAAKPPLQMARPATPPPLPAAAAGTATKKPKSRPSLVPVLLLGGAGLFLVVALLIGVFVFLMPGQRISPPAQPARAPVVSTRLPPSPAPVNEVAKEDTPAPAPAEPVAVPDQPAAPEPPVASAKPPAPAEVVPTPEAPKPAEPGPAEPPAEPPVQPEPAAPPVAVEPKPEPRPAEPVTPTPPMVPSTPAVEPWPQFTVKGIMRSGNTVVVLMADGETLESGKANPNGLAITGMQGNAARIRFRNEVRLFKRGDTPATATPIPR